jgi:hypothetical protein
MLEFATGLVSGLAISYVIAVSVYIYFNKG